MYSKSSIWLKLFIHLITLMILSLTILAWADDAQPLAQNPELEAKVMNIATELRCLVCQNETIAGSHADLAIDLRNQIRVQLTQGKSKQEIIDYMVARYGDFVLYNPPLKSNTLFLWLGPFALLIIGFILLFRHIRSEKQAALTIPSSKEDLERARTLLNTPLKDLE